MQFFSDKCDAGSCYARYNDTHDHLNRIVVSRSSRLQPAVSWSGAGDRILLFGLEKAPQFADVAFAHSKHSWRGFVYRVRIDFKHSSSAALHDVDLSDRNVRFAHEQRQIVADRAIRHLDCSKETKGASEKPGVAPLH